jgi:hypothetical protein
MIRLIAVAGLALSVAVSAQAMTPAPIMPAAWVGHINCLLDGRTSKPAAEPLQRAVPSPVALGFSAAAGSRGTSIGLAETCWLPPTRCFRTSPRRFSEQASHRLRPNGD